MNTSRRGSPQRMASAALVALAVAGCASVPQVPQVVVQKEREECKVPAVVTNPVDAPAKLQPGAKNEDLRRRELALEAALEKANGRLADVQQALTSSPASTGLSVRERLRKLLGKS